MSRVRWLMAPVDLFTVAVRRSLERRRVVAFWVAVSVDVVVLQRESMRRHVTDFHVGKWVGDLIVSLGL